MSGRRWVDWAAGGGALLVSAAFGYVALRDVNWTSTWHALGETNYSWTIPSLATLAVWTVIRAVRWRALFRSEARPHLQPIAQATIVGLFFNSILPARAGEAARIVWLRSRAGVSSTESTATIVVDRLFDVLCLFALLFLLLPWFPRVAWLHAGAVAALATLGATLLLIAGLLYLERRPLCGLHGGLAFRGSPTASRMARPLSGTRVRPQSPQPGRWRRGWCLGSPSGS